MNEWKKVFINSFQIIAICLTFGFFTTLGAITALKITGFEGINQTNIVVTDEQVKQKFWE